MKRISTPALVSALVAMAAFAMASCGDPKPENEPGPGPGPDPDPTPVITIVTQPASPGLLTAGEIPAGTVLTVAATVTGDATLTCQWYENTTATNTGGTAIEGATGASYTIPTDIDAGSYYYFCEVGAEGATSVRTNVVTVTVGPKAVAIPVIAIVAQPIWPGDLFEGEIPEGLRLTVEAIVTGDATLTYQWYMNMEPSYDGSRLLEGETGASYTIPTDLATNVYYFYVEVSAPGAEPVLSEIRPMPVFRCIASPGYEVTVGDVAWAGANVGETAGTFATDASAGGTSAYGGYYQFNRIQGWPTSGNMTGWDNWPDEDAQEGWAAENDPCPAGWRIPTKDEWGALYAARKGDVEWTFSNGGLLSWALKDNGGTIYLPATGYRDYTNGSAIFQGGSGLYWSSTPNSAVSGYALLFNGTSVTPANPHNYPNGSSVRCVRPVN